MYITRFRYIAYVIFYNNNNHKLVYSSTKLYKVFTTIFDVLIFETNRKVTYNYHFKGRV